MFLQEFYVGHIAPRPPLIVGATGLTGLKAPHSGVATAGGQSTPPYLKTLRELPFQQTTGSGIIRKWIVGRRSYRRYGIDVMPREARPSGNCARLMKTCCWWWRCPYFNTLERMIMQLVCVGIYRRRSSWHGPLALCPSLRWESPGNPAFRGFRAWLN